MHIDLSTLSKSQVYFTMTQTLIPRPIAWVLTENAHGGLNVAPYSYFNAVCSDPPLIMLSVGKKPDGTSKDTHVNIEKRHDFVVHIAHREMLEALNESSATLPADVSEVDRLGLETVPLQGSRLGRLKECRLAYICERYQIQEIGNARQALILGRVTGIYIDDSVVERDAKGRLKVHADRLEPIGRLGAAEYMTFGEIVHLARPD